MIYANWKMLQWKKVIWLKNYSFYEKNMGLHFDSFVNHNEKFSSYSYREKCGSQCARVHFPALWPVGESKFSSKAA